jgi:uncharacterized protein (TIGR02453 family)
VERGKGNGRGLAESSISRCLTKCSTPSTEVLSEYLKRNNNRDWFLEHRSAYDESVRLPMLKVIEALAPEFQRFAPDVLASPRSLFRINRDTRFSKDKSPYKTHVAASFSVRGLDRHEGAGFYFHIAPTELWIGGGVYRPMPDELRLVRDHIAGNHERLDKIVKARRFKKLFGELAGEQSLRVPRGYPKDHPAEHYLRHKDWLAARELPAQEATKPDFFKTLVESFEAMNPLIQFLNEPILHRRAQKNRQDHFFS